MLLGLKVGSDFYTVMSRLLKALERVISDSRTQDARFAAVGFQGVCSWTRALARVEGVRST